MSVDPHSLTLADNTLPAPDRTYWVAHSWLLAGAYPGHPEPVEHASRVEAIRAAGCSTFVNLIEEGEKNTQEKSFASYVDVLDSLRPRWGKANCLRFPVRDLPIPSREMMRSILDAMDTSIEARRPVYVHCFGGVGRTGRSFSAGFCVMGLQFTLMFSTYSPALELPIKWLAIERRPKCPSRPASSRRGGNRE